MVKLLGPPTDPVVEYRGDGLRITVDRRDAERTELRSAQCTHCDAGFRRDGGIHIGSQRLGMIPDVACARVFATRTPDDRAWMAYFDGEPVRNKNGEARRFATTTGAYNAARKASPKRWHP